MFGTIVIFAYLFWNMYCFFLMYSDKQKAIEGEYRVPEKKLIKYALLFGGFGIVFGMMTFSHKISKPEFIFKVVMAIIANIFLCGMLVVLYL